MLSYAASLVFSLKTHEHLFAPGGRGRRRRDAARAATSGPCARASGVLLAAAVMVGVVSEFLVHAVDEAGKAMGLGKVFMGVVVVAIVGNAAEHSTAILVAMKGKMDLALGIAMGSSMQIALFVAPVLVIAGHLMGDAPGPRVHAARGGGGDALRRGGGPPHPRRQDQLVRRVPAPGDLRDPGHRLLLHLDSPWLRVGTVLPSSAVPGVAAMPAETEVRVAEDLVELRATTAALADVLDRLAARRA